MKANIHDVKTHLSKYLEELAEGETLVICKRNEPIAELKLLPKKNTAPRPMGLAKGMGRIPDSFWDPLPDEIIEGFYGGPFK